MASDWRDRLDRWLQRDSSTVDVTRPHSTPPRLRSGSGQAQSTAAAILETVAWLEARGWAGTDRGWLQCYALYLLACRDAYEAEGVR